ncbi:TPA: lipopolysaccharide heptosyltransferase family protein, partial [Morganella morganii]|nr:lipopolysaccharide heptosyltransferase family protein [Morganella morganii]
MKKKKFAKLRTLNRKRNYMMKNIRYYSRLFIEKILWDKKSKSAIDFTAVKSILILRNEGKIGDVIVDSGLIKVLSQHGYDVDIIVTPDNCSIMQHDKHIRSIYIADKISLNDFMKKRNHNVSSDIIHQLNENKYDLI